MAIISIGLITHNESAHIIHNCLSSLDASLQEANTFAELIFIKTEFSTGNAGASHLTQNFFPQFKNFSKIILVPLLPAQNSISFKRNLILEMATEKYLYFTDPDVMHSKSMFKEFLSQLDLLKNENCFGFTGPLKQKSRNFFVNIQVRMIGLFSKFFGLAFQGTDLTDQKVDHAPCAHLFLDKDKTKVIGGFSERFESVGEDLDLSHRITQAGGHYLSIRTTATHSLPSYIESYRKFYNYGRAQIMVQLQNGTALIRWYRLIPFVVGITIVFLSQVHSFFIPVFAVFTVSVLGAYFYGMVSELILELYRRTFQRLLSPSEAK